MPDYSHSAADLVPEHLQPGLARYILHGVLPGSFLKAVLSNNLLNAAVRADETSLAALPDIARFLLNSAPPACYGTGDKMQFWARGRGFKGWT